MTHSSMRKKHEQVKEAVREKAEVMKETAEAMKEKAEALKLKHPHINKLLILFIGLFAFWELLLYLHSTNYITIPDVFLSSSRSIIIILSILAITSIVVRLSVNRIFKLFEGEVDIEYRIFLTKLYTAALYIFAVILILYFLNIGMTLEQFTLMVTVLTTGIAFAIRDIVFSYFVWAILLTKKPFRIGDVVAFGEDIGRVKRIGTFFVTLERSDASLIKAPNKMMLDKNFVVHGERVKEYLMIRMKSPPSDAMNGFDKTKQALRQIVGSDVSVNLSSNIDSLHLLIEYEISLESRFKIRTAVLAKVSDMHRDMIAYKTL